MTEDGFQNRASFGMRHEYIVIAELLRQGFDVYIPLVDDRQIDCVIRRDTGDYLDLQIKARSRDSDLGTIGRFAALSVQAPRENYLFIFYVEHPDVDAYWILPSLELVKKASQNKSGKNKGKYTIDLARFYKRRGKVCPVEKFLEYMDTDRTFERLLGHTE